MKYNILVTGGFGLLGKPLVLKLLSTMTLKVYLTDSMHGKASGVWILMTGTTMRYVSMHPMILLFRAASLLLLNQVEQSLKLIVIQHSPCFLAEKIRDTGYSKKNRLGARVSRTDGTPILWALLVQLIPTG